MKTIYTILLLFLLLLRAEEKRVELTVSYISAEHVYLSGGKKQGLQTGNTAQVVRAGKVIAELRVVYTADRSASCKIVKSSAPIQPGDKVLVFVKQVEKQTPAKPSAVTEKAPAVQSRVKKKSSTRVSGSLSLQWYQFVDEGESGIGFAQPAIRFNLRARRLWNRDYNFQVRFRSRYYERANRPASSTVPAAEWRNRLYMLSFSYDNPAATFNFKAGRILSNAFSGIGYVDGLQLQHNINRAWHWGVFAGFQPELVYSGFQSERRKYGLYVHFVKGDYGSQRFETTISAAGEYEASTVSRELIYVQTSYSQSGSWSFYQSMELDVNRQRRKEKTGQDVSLSSLYLSGQMWLGEGLSATLSYDNRRNYYIYEYRSLADSLFDDAFRQGLRIRVNYRFLKNYRVYLSGGLRQRESEDRFTYSYSGGLLARNVIIPRLSFNARAAAFSNLYNRGVTYSLRLSQYLRGGHNFSLAYGANEYRLRLYDAGGLNRWARANVHIQLPLRLYLSGYYEYDWGNDLQGYRFMAETGYNF